MTSARELVVRYQDRDVARVIVEGEQLGLHYEREWIASNGFPISLSLPVVDAPVVGGAAHAFLKNLLPEGQAREAVCRRLGISIDNDFALLRAIGGECAGALTIVEAGAPSSATADDYEVLGDRRLETLAKREGIVPLLLGGPPTRLSLAGAQDKLPVAVFDGTLYLPLMGSPSTHILKLPHATFAHVPLNEMYVMGLAARIGLAPASTELVTRTNPPCLLVERYDRVVGEGDHVSRLHQEDLCQALGVSPLRKYEDEGGPSLARAITLIRSHTRQPIVDVRRLIEWQAFNVVAGNCDGHGKNLSILYEGGSLTLAPFYDLLSTRQYPALDRRLAMSVGGRREPTELHRAQWEALARDAGIQPRTVVDLVRDVAERAITELPTWTKEYRDRYGRRAILETIPRWIATSAKRVVRQLTS